MNDSENNGLGFWEILCLILITLKLTDQIDWWWGWVILPGIIKHILGYLILLLGWILELKRK